MALNNNDLIVVNKASDGSLAKATIEKIGELLGAGGGGTGTVADHSFSFIDRSLVQTTILNTGVYESLDCISVSIGEQPTSTSYSWLEYNAPTGFPGGGGGETPDDATPIMGLFGPYNEAYLPADKISKDKVNCKVTLTFADGSTRETMQADWIDAFDNPFGDPTPLIEEAPKDGNQYVRKDGAWVQLAPGSSGSSFETALFPTTDSFTGGSVSVQMNTKAITDVEGTVPGLVEYRWWQFDGDGGETVDDVVPVYSLGDSPSNPTHEWFDRLSDNRLSFLGQHVDANAYGIQKSDLTVETRVTYTDGTQVSKFAINSCKITIL